MTNPFDNPEDYHVMPISEEEKQGLLAEGFATVLADNTLVLTPVGERLYAMSQFCAKYVLIGARLEAENCDLLGENASLMAENERLKEGVKGLEVRFGSVQAKLDVLRARYEDEFGQRDGN
jgi:hypothetical protein